MAKTHFFVDKKINQLGNVNPIPSELVFFYLITVGLVLFDFVQPFCQILQVNIKICIIWHIIAPNGFQNCSQEEYLIILGNVGVVRN